MAALGRYLLALDMWRATPSSAHAPTPATPHHHSELNPSLPDRAGVTSSALPLEGGHVGVRTTDGGLRTLNTEQMNGPRVTRSHT